MLNIQPRSILLRNGTRAESAKAIRLLRHRAGQTQVALARRLHLSQPIIALRESGQRSITLEQYAAVVRATNHVLRITMTWNGKPRRRRHGGGGG